MCLLHIFICKLQIEFCWNKYTMLIWLSGFRRYLLYSDLNFSGFLFGDLSSIPWALSFEIFLNDFGFSSWRAEVGWVKMVFSCFFLFNQIQSTLPYLFSFFLFGFWNLNSSTHASFPFARRENRKRMCSDIVENWTAWTIGGLLNCEKGSLGFS